MRLIVPLIMKMELTKGEWTCKGKEGDYKGPRIEPLDQSSQRRSW